MDGTEAGVNSEDPSVEEVSVSESVSVAGASCLPVPEASAGPSGCLMDQRGQCPEWPPVTRNPFTEDPQTAPEDVINLYVDGQDTDIPLSSEKLSQRVALLESEVVEQDKTKRRLKGTVNEMSDTVAQREKCARNSQAKLEDQAKQYMKEQERLWAGVAT